MAQAEAPLSKLPWMANCSTNRRGRPTPEGWRHAAKRSPFLSSCISWRPTKTVGDPTLLQIWQHSRSGTQHRKKGPVLNICPPPYIACKGRKFTPKSADLVDLSWWRFSLKTHGTSLIFHI